MAEVGCVLFGGITDIHQRSRKEEEEPSLPVSSLKHDAAAAAAQNTAPRTETAAERNNKRRGRGAVLLGPHVQQQLQITGEILDRKKQLKIWTGEEFRSKRVLCDPRVRRELGIETKQRTATRLLPRPSARSLELCNADLPFPSHLLPLSLPPERERGLSTDLIQEPS
ncbi:unnamed protein product [Sphagnum troendelagicum]|uniref:Uncharacterized protein n=1 Tax=Sphagnum troendelagicum TaxID=128251 RepID=A0ABP0UII4_9BRYO